MPKTMKKETLEEKSVEELREMAAKQEIEGRSQMNKGELVDSLATGGQTESKTGTATGAGTAPTTHLEVKGAELGGKNPTRLFQTGPHEKTWLTKEQAENWEVTDPATGKKVKSPFYWKD